MKILDLRSLVILERDEVLVAGGSDAEIEYPVAVLMGELDAFPVKEMVRAHVAEVSVPC